MMRAAVIPRYGPPAVLEIRDVPRPDVRPGRVLIRVRAAGVNPLDWRIRSGSLRLLLPLKLPLIPGYDVSGEVAEVGEGVTQFQPGDEVFAFLDAIRGGAYAEFVGASPSVVARKPANLSHEEAAAVPLAASTALYALRDIAKIHSQSEVLINGAAGGVGSFAVQLAKALGACVTGVCGPENIDFVGQLGADRALDYHKTDFTRQPEQYDLVFDAVSKSSYGKCRGVMKTHGHYVSTVPTPMEYFHQGVTWLLGGRRSHTFLVRPRGADLRHLATLIESGRLRPIVQRAYPLDEVAQAHEASQAGHVRGKLVLRIGD